MAPPPGPPAAGPATGPVIAVFDVDRTLLRGDCLHLAVRRSQGPLGLLAGGLALAPSLVAWWLRRLSTGALKENALALFHVCDAVNQAEAAGRGDWLLPALIRDLRPAALARLREHQRRGDRVVLCSASPRMLLQPLAHWLGVELLATELRVQEGRWLPVLAGPNCKGPEKVRRLQAHLGGMEGLVLEAYGDSRGDRELLRAADRPHYRSFQAEPHPYPETAVPPRPSPTIRSCFVLGSTSVVAQAICRELALRGCGRFHLIARDGLRNAEVAEALRELSGAAVSTEHTDLCDDASLQEVRRPRVGEFDLYLITAGWLGDAERARMDPAEALRITAANYSGLVPWLTAIATPERLARPGRLWVFSSVAGDRGRPSNAHYGAAKAALTTFCEGLLLRCHGKPFAVRVLKAGFMATPMAAGRAPAALCVAPSTIARALLRRTDRRGIEYLPWWWGPLMALVRRLPAVLVAKG